MVFKNLFALKITRERVYYEEFFSHEDVKEEKYDEEDYDDDDYDYYLTTNYAFKILSIT